MKHEEKNWWQEHKGKIQSALIGIAVIGVAVGGYGTWRMYQNRRMVELMIEARNAEENDASQASEAVSYNGDIPIAPGQKEEHTADPRDLNLMPILAENLVTYKGKTYRRNQYVKAILCMGVDRSDTMTESKEFGSAGQSDGIFLIAQDTVHHSLKILMIPRDTMTEVPHSTPDDPVQETMITQLTIAYAFGDGREGSCKNTVESVEKLLSGFSIDQYLAVDTTVIAKLNDAVGGVTVTIPTDGMEQRDPAFVKGIQVTLHGSQAEAFVRYRDINRDNSALYRMDQQQEYITQYFKAIKEASKTDSQIVTKLFDMIQDYMVTDMSKDQYLKIAMDGLDAGNLTAQDFYTVPGTGEVAETHDVYRADRQATIPIILKLFYREES